MYEKFFGLDSKPFELRPDPAFMYFSERHLTALSLLEYGLFHHDGFSVITGDVGCGKTTIVRYLVERLENDVSVGVVANTHRAFGDLMQWVLQAFGLEFRRMGGAEMYHAFVEFLGGEQRRGKRVVLIVDEAQNLDPQGLEELRLLSNVNGGDTQVLHTALVGQPELKVTLSRSDLWQFRQRIATSFHLEPLSSAETEGYIRRRVAVAGGAEGLFDARCAALVHGVTGGIPRLINVICDAALVYSYGERARHVTTDIVLQVAADRRTTQILPVIDGSAELGVGARPSSSSLQ